MAKDDKDPYELHKPWKNECSCKECNKDKCCGECKSMRSHPSFQLKVETPLLSVEEAIEVYRKAKSDKVTTELALRHAKEKIAELEAKLVTAANEENRAKMTLERAFEDEAKNNG